MGPDHPPVDDAGAGEEGQSRRDPADLSAGLGVAVVESSPATIRAPPRTVPAVRAQPTKRSQAGRLRPVASPKTSTANAATTALAASSPTVHLGSVADGTEVEQMGDDPGDDDQRARAANDAAHGGGILTGRCGSVRERPARHFCRSGAP